MKRKQARPGAAAYILFAAVFALNAGCDPSGLWASDKAVAGLADPGSPELIDYSKYGRSLDAGTERFRYQITDLPGLTKAAGEGVYPNRSHLSDPAYRSFADSHPQNLDPWEFEAAGASLDGFYAWCLSDRLPEDQKTFFKAEALRRSGHILQAIKAYYAILIHFPRVPVWASDNSFHWYPSLEAVGRIRKLCALHPELGLNLENAFVDVDYDPSGDASKDVVRVWPGEFVSRPAGERVLPAVESLPIIDRRGSGKVCLVKYDNGHWQLLKDGKPFIVKGVTYSCTTVGESAHALNLRPWMTLDDNRNGQNDGMFDSWIDKNRNNQKDPGEEATGDAALLKSMGANAIRFYHGVDRAGDYDPACYDKELMRRLANEFGVYFILGDFVGAYTVGSGADWSQGTDYTDPQQRRQMMDTVKAMVLDHKDEPYVLFWLLGNENEHPNTHTNAGQQPAAYAGLLNEIAQMIHRIDPDHPVAVCGLGTAALKAMTARADAVDIFGANCYYGNYSFGSLWLQVKRLWDRPVLITEFGSDAYGLGDGRAELFQADYFEANWKDILLNSAGQRGEGNAIGGVVFEWMDEWWKTSRGNSWGDPDTQNTEGDMAGPFLGGRIHEEWLGICSQGNGVHSPLLRQTRLVYERIKNQWNPERS